MNIVFRAANGREVSVPLEKCKPYIEGNMQVEDVIDRLDHWRINRVPVVNYIAVLRVPLTLEQCITINQLVADETPKLPKRKDELSTGDSVSEQQL